MAISLKKARELCTDAELKLVTSSQKKHLAEQSASELKKNVTRARTLRDKWRDQARGQRRQTQKKMQARTTSANARSEEKAELFDQVLERFQGQLDRTQASATSGKRQAGTKTAKATAAPSKKKAVAAGSAASATRKKTARKKTAAAKKKPAKGVAAAKIAAGKKTGGGNQPHMPDMDPLAKKGRKAAPPRVAQDQLTMEAERQTAEFDAKQTVKDQTGLTSRTRGHVSARGKRAQSRRDSRG